MSIPRRKTYPLRMSEEEWEATMLARRLQASQFGQQPPAQRDATKLSGQGLNPYLDCWMAAVTADKAVGAETLLVANALSRSVGIGRVALTDWQRLNRDLGRESRDPRVHSNIRELQTAGYLGRHQGNMYHSSRGWRIQLPGEDQ